MEPATIAIIPLVLLVVGIYIGSVAVLKNFVDMNDGTEYAISVYVTLVVSLLLFMFWALGYVVYTNSWTW